MRKSKFAEAEIPSAVKQVGLGIPVAEVCRKLGITSNTFYSRWRRFGWMEASEIKRLKQLEEENRRIKPCSASEQCSSSQHSCDS